MWKNNTGIQYIQPTESTKSQNQASNYVNKSLTKNDRYNIDIMKDYRKALDNGAYYLPNFFEETNDRTIFNKLKQEISSNPNCTQKEWSKHYKYENPDYLSTVNEIVDKMAKHFNVEVYHTRLNYYQDETSWKPLHKDQNAYSDKRGNFTMGASFGDTRALEFVHDGSDAKFTFPQNNGDVFSFNDEVNKAFMHGVPKTKKQVGERFSIIAWGEKFRQ
ncbi:2OG-FeII oxygenase superfamily protein [Indivirus ILV1]|uniref:2OG-FeII oxygenase superfamily protein n=1 Tax=Indivirus ILV1 TaxID=1977633 RepID=A0A1V0SEB1_9VIRU|nr:2OG-FeII oxygenase superfamily protein [Indivirus ILV1]